MWIAGYSKRDEPVSGVAQNLHVKAVAIEDEDRKTVVLVSAKLLGITPDLRDDVLAACESEYDLDPDEVLLNVSHTHNGPEYRTDNYGILGFDDELTERSRAYRARLEDELVDVIGAALDDRCSAVLRYSHASCGMAMSRRLPEPDGIDFRRIPTASSTTMFRSSWRYREETSRRYSSATRVTQPRRRSRMSSTATRPD